MKNILLSFTFALSPVAINAQVNSNDTSINTQENKTNLNPDANNSDTRSLQVNYEETSKIAYYETLISKNKLKIKLKNSKKLVKNTEDIIFKNRNQTLYTEED